MKSIILLGALVCLSEASSWWMDQPYGDDDYNTRVEYGDQVNITCEDPRLGNSTYTVQFWVLPDLTIMRAGDYKDFRTIDGQAGWEVSADASEIRLFTITENHFGFYHCLANSSDPIDETGETHIMMKRATNYKGAYFGDVWEDYRLNTIIGLSSAVAFLAIAGSAYGFMIWWGKRSSSKVNIEEESEMSEIKTDNIPEKADIQEMGAENNGFTPDGMKEDVDQNETPVTEQPKTLEV